MGLRAADFDPRDRQVTLSDNGLRMDLSCYEPAGYPDGLESCRF